MAIFTIIYFMPESLMVVYPICAASIVSSFGCIYLAAYICNSVQTAYHAQELEMRQAYYRDKRGMTLIAAYILGALAMGVIVRAVAAEHYRAASRGK